MTPRLPRDRSTYLIALLISTTFAIALVLAWQARASVRAHRGTVERTLQDYAAFAAVQLASRARDEVYPRIATLLADSSESGCASHRFAIDLSARSVGTSSDACVPPAVSAWLRDTVIAHATTEFRRGWSGASIVARPAPAAHPAVGEPWFVGYTVRYDARGRAAVADGFAMPERLFFAPIFADLMRRAPLLPPALVGTTPNDSLLAAVVTDASGTVLFTSAPLPPSPFLGEETTDRFGGMVTRVALRPDVAERLVIGGLPQSRATALLVLLGVAAAMLALAVMQLRRGEELTRLRADFVASVSHELRTPLARMQIFGDTLLLGRARSDEERRRALEVISQEIRRLTHVVENVLQISRAERAVRSDSRIASEPIEIGAAVTESVDAFAPLARSCDATIAIDVAAEAEDARVAIDRVALRQIVFNLLDNAVKYGPTGQSVCVRVERADDARMRIVVDDGGDGIPANERDRIWLPFHRLARHAESAASGSGIGLAVVRELVTLAGGRAWVEDAPSRGARFIVELPVAAERV